MLPSDDRMITDCSRPVNRAERQTSLTGATDLSDRARDLCSVAVSTAERASATTGDAHIAVTPSARGDPDLSAY